MNKILSFLNITQSLAELSNPVKAPILQRFFKTGKGEYGEGDIFLGISVPMQRRIATQYKHLPLPHIQKLLKSKVHEHRFTALEILVMQYESGNEKTKKAVFNFYIKNTAFVNNWDLVDTSVAYIIGPHLRSRNRRLLYAWSKSKNIWERRMAIVATFDFIRLNDFSDTLTIAEALIRDPHDLIHKATGWMLREVGKRDRRVLLRFLDSHAHHMPRTMLRYSIEHLPAEMRQSYLSKKQHETKKK